MITNKCSALIGLSLHLQRLEALVQGAVESSLGVVELSFEGSFKL